MANLITPPDDLVRDWARFQNHEDPEALWRRIATLAARWGSNQELEACCEWLYEDAIPNTSNRLRNARRPKPPTLKKQALLQLDTLNADLAMHGMGCDLSQIRRALEALPND